jgi:hypothetical protein
MNPMHRFIILNRLTPLINITYNISNDFDVENDENDQGESISYFTSDDEIDSDKIVYYNIESDDNSFEASDGLSTVKGSEKEA